MPQEHVIHRTELKKLILSGNASITLRNTENGNRKTYRISKLKDGDIYFVNVRGDADKITKANRRKNWLYMGCIFDNGEGNFNTTRKSKVQRNSDSFKGFDWLWKKIKNNEPLPEKIEVLHTGFCCRCGRELTDPESVQRGLGPECAKKD